MTLTSFPLLAPVNWVAAARFAANSKNLSRRTLGIRTVNFCDLAAAHHDLEPFGCSGKKKGSFFLGDIGNQVSEPVDLEHHPAQPVLIRRFRLRRVKAHEVFHLVAKLERIDLFG